MLFMEIKIIFKILDEAKKLKWRGKVIGMDRQPNTALDFNATIDEIIKIHGFANSFVLSLTREH